MVDPKAVSALVVGVLLSAIGGLGALVVLVGSLVGALEWTIIAWLLVLVFVGGTGIATYAGILLAGDLVDLIGGGNYGEISQLTELID